MKPTLRERLELLLKEYEALQTARQETLKQDLKLQNYALAAKTKLVIVHNEIFISELKTLLK